MSEDTTPGGEIHELEIHPVWKQAAREASREYDYGDIIPLEWIREKLEISEPDGLLTIKQHRKLAFDLLQKMDGFRNVMLEEHKRLLINVRGVGYKIIEPPHQTDAAMKRFQREFLRSWRQAMTALVHINESALTLEDARENADAKAKLAWFKSAENAINKGDNQTSLENHTQTDEDDQ